VFNCSNVVPSCHIQASSLAKNGAVHLSGVVGIVVTFSPHLCEDSLKLSTAKFPNEIGNIADVGLTNVVDAGKFKPFINASHVQKSRWV